MTAPALAILARCRRLGVAVRADGGRLMFRPASVVPADLRTALAEHKPELLAALTDPAPVPTPGDPEPLDDWIGRYWRPLNPADPAEAAVLRGRRHNRLKRKQGRPPKSGQNEHFIKTAQRLAREYGVSEMTIRRDGQFAEAVEKAGTLDPELERKVISGKGPPKAAVIMAAELLDRYPDLAREVLEGRRRRPRGGTP